MAPEKLPWRFRSSSNASRARDQVREATVVKAQRDLTRRERRLAALEQAEARLRCQADGCTAMVVLGTTRCVAHTALPAVKGAAEAHLQALAAPAIQRLETLMHQNQNLSVSLHAIEKVLNRSLGPVAKEDGDKRPQIRIAIAVGGVPMPVKEGPVELPEPVPEGEIVVTPEMERAMREDA